MPKLADVIQLKEHEEVRAITRRHGITIVPRLALALVLIVAPFFFLFPLFSSGPAGIVLFLAVVSAGGVIALRAIVMWDGDIIIFTNKRIVDVDQKGVFARTVNEIAFENVQDFSWSKTTMLDQMLNIGHFMARSASGSLTIEGRFVPRPHDLQNLANELRQEAIDVAASIAKSPPTPARSPQQEESSPERSALMQQVSRHMQKMDDEKLSKLARSLKDEERDIAIKKLFGDGVGAESEELKPLEEEIDSKEKESET